MMKNDLLALIWDTETLGLCFGECNENLYKPVSFILTVGAEFIEVP